MSLRTLLAQGGAGAIILIFGGGLGFLSEALLARWLGADAFGSFSGLMALAALLALLGGLGTEHACYRFISPRWAAGHEKDAGRLAGHLFRIALVGAVVATPLLWAGGLLTGQPVPLLALLLVPILVLSGLAEDLVHVTSSYPRSLWPRKVVRPVALLGILLAALHLDMEGSLDRALLLWVGTGVLPVAILLALLRRRVRLDGSRYRTRAVLGYGLGAVGFSIALLLVEEFAIIALWAMGHHTSVAYLAAAGTLHAAMFLLYDAIGTVASRNFGALKDDSDALCEAHLTAVRTAFGGYVLGAFGVWALSPFLVAIYGFPFREVAVPLAIYTVCWGIYAAFGLVGSLQAYAGRPGLITTSALGWAAAGMGLLFVLLGPLGATLAGAVSVGVAAAGYAVTLWIMSRKMYGIGWAMSPGATRFYLGIAGGALQRLRFRS